MALPTVRAAVNTAAAVGAAATAVGAAITTEAVGNTALVVEMVEVARLEATSTAVLNLLSVDTKPPMVTAGATASAKRVATVARTSRSTAAIQLRIATALL